MRGNRAALESAPAAPRAQALNQLGRIGTGHNSALGVLDDWFGDDDYDLRQCSGRQSIVIEQILASASVDARFRSNGSTCGQALNECAQDRMPLVKSCRDSDSQGYAKSVHSRTH